MEREPIPSTGFIFRWIHPVNWVAAENRPSSGAFADPEMSVDWDKYSDIEKTAVRQSPKNGAVAIEIAFARDPDPAVPELKQDVTHDPISAKAADSATGAEAEAENHAHTIVKGKKTQSLRKKICSHVIKFRHIAPTS